MSYPHEANRWVNDLIVLVHLIQDYVTVGYLSFVFMSNYRWWRSGLTCRSGCIQKLPKAPACWRNMYCSAWVATILLCKVQFSMPAYCITPHTSMFTLVEQRPTQTIRVSALTLVISWKPEEKNLVFVLYSVQYSIAAESPRRPHAVL